MDNIGWDDNRDWEKKFDEISGRMLGRFDSLLTILDNLKLHINNMEELIDCYDTNNKRRNTLGTILKEKEDEQTIDRKGKGEDSTQESI